MSKEEIFDLVKQYFIKECEIPEEKITLKAHLFTDLELDSIDALDMIGMLESEMNIEVDEDELKKIRTVSDVVEYVMKKMSGLKK
jgi:acyl carrier protein